MDHIVKHNHGNAAEHLIVAALFIAGFRSSITSHQAPYDIVCDAFGKSVIRVEVKSTRKVTEPGDVYLDWAKNFAAVEVIGLVKFPECKFAFIPSSRLRAGKSAILQLDHMETFGALGGEYSAQAAIRCLTGRESAWHGRLRWIERDRYASNRIGAATRAQNTLLRQNGASHD